MAASEWSEDVRCYCHRDRELFYTVSYKHCDLLLEMRILLEIISVNILCSKVCLNYQQSDIGRLLINNLLSKLKLTL